VSEEYEFKSIREVKAVLSLLSKPICMKIIAMLRERPMYIREIARELGAPYALIHLYLSNLEKYGIVKSEYEFVRGNKPHVRRYYKLSDFKIVITPEIIARLVGEEK